MIIELLYHLLLRQHFHSPEFAARREVRVAHSHLHVGVAHKFPHRVQVNAFHDKLGREVMPHVVPSEIFNPRLLQKISP